ncbi:MAG: ABC transporter ATP-binding protein [Lachnospiraceae bacterium]|jgi:teichoic acid transport system ATP-binding protein|nr:ABC transporter ATP-binding protein [Lachnospiraceae bacterium]MCI9395486.1 ABC transporter ATP-binding protein [Lachnospiraceae bacterium]
MDNHIAIKVTDLEKVYKLYDKPSERLKEALHIGRGKHHTEHRALKGVNMTIRQGECVGIIGTNGSGKSTILKIITGVLSPTAGEVEVNGRISALLELGAGFNMEYNGIENIYLNGTMIGFSKKEIDQKLDEILAFADIGDYVYQPAKTYSSGMFVRLAFAVAINIDPEILIVDEALSVGDVFFQAKCYHKFEEFKEMGKTIVFVSHDLSSISKYCDRVVLLNQGIKLGEGAPKQMIDTYKQVLVGQYTAPESEGERLLDDEQLRAMAAKGVDGSKMDGAEPGKRNVSGATACAENPELLEYGSKKAQITEYYITDEKGTRTATILKGSAFTIHMRVEMTEKIAAPIFAFTIKTVRGTEITGTNTMFEKAFLESVEAGETKEITFTQDMNLQGGEYLLSLGVTGYEEDDFTVYHRLYDVLSVTVISDKDTVGFYDMNSKVVVK